jgi:hypothetical protein
MRVARDSSGDLWFRGISPFHADTLLQVVSWLRSDDPRVRARLLPDAFADDGSAEDDWRRLVAPELDHLFASRTEILRRDLETLEPDSPVTFRMRIARGHEHAWLSSLNGARHALYLLHDLRERDMERDPAAVGDRDKELALVRIHVLAWMQELLMEHGRF